MQCPRCKLEAFITKSGYLLEDGKLYLVQEVSCLNKKCDNYKTVVEETRSEIPLMSAEAVAEETTTE